MPKAEQLLRTNVQPYIPSILEALMEPTSRGFSEVREVFFRELVEISKNSLNGEGKDILGDVSRVALYPRWCVSLKLHQAAELAGAFVTTTLVHTLHCTWGVSAFSLLVV